MNLFDSKVTLNTSRLYELLLTGPHLRRLNIFRHNRNKMLKLFDEQVSLGRG